MPSGRKKGQMRGEEREARTGINKGRVKKEKKKLGGVVMEM